MRYLFTVLMIALGWFIMPLLFMITEQSQHFLLYGLAMMNTLVLFVIGFRDV